MNREEFEARYELIEQVTRGEIESHHALHHSGVVVMVHIVSAEPSFQAEIERAVLDVGGGPPDGQVLEVHRFEGRTVLVTRFLMDFVSLESWIAGGRTAPDEPSEIPGPVAPADGPEAGEETAPAAGEFTRMFEAASPPSDPPPSDPRVGTDEGSGDPSPEDGGGRPPAREAAGEFTRMFRPQEPGEETDTGGSEAAGPDPAPREEAAGKASPGLEAGDAAPAADGGPGAGEFTRMFRSPGTGTEDGPGPPAGPDVGTHLSTGGPAPASPEREGGGQAPADEAGAGEFTRMFRPADEAPSVRPAGSGGAPIPGSTPPVPPPPPQPTSDDGPGEFTRFFSAADTPADRPPDAPAAPAGGTDQGPGEFTRFFSAPDAPSTPPGGGSSPPPTRKTPRVSPPGKEPETPSWTDALRQPSREPARPAPPEPGSPPPGSPPETPRPVEGGFTQMFGAERRPVEPGSAPARAGSPPAPTAPPPEEAPGRSDRAPKPPRSATGGTPNLDALLRRPRVPRPRAPAVVRAPTPRNIVRAAAGAIGAASGARGGDGAGGGEQEAGGKPRRGLLIGIVAVAVVTLALVLFFALWDFTPSETEGTPPPEDSVSVPDAEPGR